MKKAILLLIAIVLTLSIFIAASASLPVGTEICAEDNESSLQTATIPAQGGVGNYSKGDTSNITPVAVSADTGDNLGNAAKKMLNDAPSNESNLTKRYVDDKGRVLDEVIVPGVPPEERISEPPVLTKRYVDDKGRVLDEVIVPGVPPEERISGPPVSRSEITLAGGTILPNVPAFDWCYGCSATSAAMLFGYYDRTGYPNMYTGPTNGGVCPLTNSVWGVEECPLSATHQGFDGLAVKGHVDDYWSTVGSTVDPYYGHWTEHGYADCTADFMGTNQYQNWQNKDGFTRFYYDGSVPVCDYTGCEPDGKRDGCHGIRLFVESRGYNVVKNCNQYIDELFPGGFTYADFKAEIDAGRPVLIHVTKHTMLGFGYNDPDTIYIHDTWGHTDHPMTWGGSYSGLEHYGVTVIEMPYLCGNMNVNPTSWSPTLNCGESDNEIVTVSAGGTVEGVTVSKVSGPTWLSVSPTNLGDIASGSSKTFTMTASPPSETSGDFMYTVRVSNTCGTPSTRDVTGTIHVDCCGNMGVNPTSWSPTLNCSESDSQIVTVSASDGIVNGVTVSKVSCPTWLSVSPTNLGDIASGSSKTFTMTAAPPSETSGDFTYTVRVSNTCGTPSTRDVSGTIHVDCPCGNMGVNPTSWSPTINCGESDSQIVTVSASGGMIRGVTVSKVSVPAWLSLSPTNLGDIASGSSKTFTITASPTASLSSGTRGDFAYTVRVSNTCGSPSTRDVSGTIHVDCIEPSQPPSYSNPSVSPGSGTPSTQFDYSVDVSDPDGDTVTVTLKTYDPSDGSWEDQGNRNVIGSGTVSWNDLTPFEANDKGETAKYTFEFDDGNNIGEWGPFNGPAIEIDACFSNWDYPSTSMAAENIPVEVDISNPHGVKSAWLHYDYGDDGSEDGLTQMSLISVRGAKPEIRGGSSSGLGVKAQKITVSESAPLSGGGGFGVAEREGIPKSIYLYDAKTCKDVEDSDPYDPIGVTTVFSPTDSVSYTWLQFNDIWSSHTVKWEWYAPNGNFYSDSTLLIQDPSDSGHYEWYKCWSGIYINGYAAAEEEGIWTVKVYLDGGHIETLYFNIEYIISDYTMCKNVQASSPYDPIERTSTFLADDEMAVSWLRLDDVTNSLNVKWKWYDPSGTLYGTWDTDTPDPADEGYDYWGWIKPGCYIYIKDYAAAGKPGLWVVKVYIDDEYIFEEEFTIYPDDARYKCEIPAPGMDYAGDEVSFYVSAYSAYDSPTDSAKHLLDIYVPDHPTLSISPSSHDFGDKCEGDTDSTTFELWNSGTGTLTYSLSESGSWVEVNPTSGSSTGEHDTITVDIDTTGLSEGIHTCDITINSNDGTGTFTVRVNIVPKPDLIITEKWLCWPDNCTICYNVTNTGDGTAPSCHNTALYVDGEEVAHDHVPVDLAPGESYTGCFNGYVWTYTPPSDNITVCADNSETLDEVDGTNNCLTNIWMCGDVRKDGYVTAWDVAVLNSYVAGIGELEVERKWAGDVRTDGYITAWDVAVLNSKVAGIGAISCMCTEPDL